ncbi:MAG: hypothetical protein Q9181_002452 [Wetmoreana brouardii]
MSLPPPAFSDIAKASNDLINRDFYHTVAGMTLLISRISLHSPLRISSKPRGQV